MMTSLRRTLPCLGIVLVSGWLSAGAPEPLERMRRDLEVLASDDYEGRGIGTQGLDRAADYIQAAFAKAGLDVTAAGGDSFQEFRILDKAEPGSPNTLVLIGPDGRRIEPGNDADFRTCSFSGSASVTAPLVFAGYAIDSTTPAYNDFDGVDIQGKVLIVLRRTPQQGRDDGLFSDPHGGGGRAAELRTKISNAYRRGAAAVLLVNDGYTGAQATAQLQKALREAEEKVIAAAEGLPPSEPSPEQLKALADAVAHQKQVRQQLESDDPDPLISFGYGGPPQGDAIPVQHIRREVANQLLTQAGGKSLADLEAAIDETGRPASFELAGWKAELEANVRVKMADVKNVVGVLEGRGPRAEETVVIGAHYDHLGYGGEQSLSPGVREIHNGADDNGSGTAALLELARHFAKQTDDDRRRLVFIAFTGEERGLLGSTEYVKDPIVPLEQTVAMINLDMVGRLTDDKLTVFGTGTSTQWEAWIDAAANAEQLTLIRKPEGFGPSDHSSFYARKIPVLHLFTGVHSDYHRPGDDSEKINYEGLQRVVDFTARIVAATAQAETKPDYLEVAGKAELARGGSRPYFGSIPDFGTEEKGYAIQGVTPGSPAALGGVQAGDVMIRLGDQNIGSLDDFDLALRKYAAGEEVEVIVRRDGAEVSLKVTLGKPRE